MQTGVGADAYTTNDGDKTRLEEKKENSQRSSAQMDQSSDTIILNEDLASISVKEKGLQQSRKEDMKMKTAYQSNTK